MLQTPIWKHFAAFIYDLFPIIGLFLVTSMIVLFARNGVEVERYSVWFSAILILEVFFYFTYSWKIGGQTLGMRAWRLKIIPNQKSQLQLTWSQVSIRFVIGVLSTCFVGLGLFWKKFSPSKKSWMDLVSNSSTENVD